MSRFARALKQRHARGGRVVPLKDLAIALACNPNDPLSTHAGEWLVNKGMDSLKCSNRRRRAS